MKKILYAIAIAAVTASCTTISPLAVTNNEVGTKEGISETTCIFWLGGVSSGFVTNKTYGVAEAAKNGNITTIGSVDLMTKNFIFFSKNTLIVTGK